jgi:MFS family permease
MRGRFGLTTTVVLLGVTSLLTDVSSEMILPLLPFFLVAIGGNAFIIGLVDGVGESVVAFVKVYSGYRSDARGRRKPFVVGGYGLSTVSKVFLALSHAWPHVLAVRVGDRVGKGVRTPARDALIADATDAKSRGTAFGFHRAMDTTGAVLGPILAVLLIAAGLTFNAVFLVAAVPAGLAVIVVFLVRDERAAPRVQRFRSSLAGLPRPLRRYLGVSALFALAHLTAALFLLRAGEVLGVVDEGIGGLAPVLGLYVAFNVVYAILSFVAGRRSDRVGRVPVVLAGYFVFAGAAAGFAIVPDLVGPLSLLPLFLLLGLAFALVDGSQRALAVDLTPKEARGTSLGIFHAAIGLAALPSGILAGTLYVLYGPAAAFGTAAAVALVAGLLLPWAVRGTSP